MIVHHPTSDGWLIVTPEVERLFNAPHNIHLPDGTDVHPLYFHEADFAEDDIDGVRDYAILYVRQQANDAEARFDDRITGSPAKSIFLNTEIVQYYQAGRPANPQANIYVIANAMATRRVITLHDMLEILFDKWRDIQAELAGIVTELDRLIEEIEAAVTIDKIRLILESINF